MRHLMKSVKEHLEKYFKYLNYILEQFATTFVEFSLKFKGYGLNFEGFGLN